MFWGSLQWRLVIIFTSIILVLMLSISIILYVSVQSKFYDVFEESIDKGFVELDTYMKEKGINEPSSNDLVHILNSKGGQNGAAIYFSITGRYKSYTLIEKKTRKIISSSDLNNEKEYFINEILKSSNLLAVLSGEDISESRVPVKLSSGDYFDYAKIMNLSDGEFIVYFRNNREEWQPIINEFTKIIIFGSCVALFISIVLGYILSKTITIPINNVMRKAQKISQGEFGQLLEVKSDDEIGKLTDTFNIMALELKNTLIEISGEKSKIETILHYMTDGVVAFNRQGYSIHSNPAALKMFEFKEFIYDFNEFSRKFSLGIKFEEFTKKHNDGKELELKVKVNEKILMLYFAPVLSEDSNLEGIVVVIRDNTVQQKLEDMRREFVANVSHELKTPLTSIKSYSETLLEGASEDKDTLNKFLNVINSEADRMARLVKDLLQLSRFDINKMQWNIEKFSLSSIVYSLVDKMMLEINSKNQMVDIKVEDDLPEILADRDRIEQVVVNILTNALKYTPNDGSIMIRISKKGKSILFEVEDTGIGIPQRDIGRIFERFYRVDKARSREMGGTGLGLAIAKEIIEYHKGIIYVESQIGKGTTVSVEMPILA